MKTTGQAVQRNAKAAPPRVPSGAPAGSPRDARRPKMPPGRAWMWFAIALLLNYTIVRALMPSPEAPVTVPYTLFRAQVAENNVEAIYSRGETITGQFLKPVVVPPPTSSSEKKAEEEKEDKEANSPLSKSLSFLERKPVEVKRFTATMQK